VAPSPGVIVQQEETSQKPPTLATSTRSQTREVAKVPNILRLRNNNNDVLEGGEGGIFTGSEWTKCLSMVRAWQLDTKTKFDVPWVNS
jgi:hypothetical protein